MLCVKNKMYWSKNWSLRYTITKRSWSWVLSMYIKTVCVRFSKYDWNQDSTVSPNPNTLWRRCSKISWSIVSNAADRSRSTSTEILSSSIAECKSFVTFKRAVSVLWCTEEQIWRWLWDGMLSISTMVWST